MADRRARAGDEQDHGRGQTRRFGRLLMRRSVRVLVQDGPDWSPIYAKGADLSLGGCSLRMLEPLETGSPILVAFDGDWKLERRIVYGVVRHCTFDGAEWVKVGVEFRCLPESVAAAWLFQHYAVDGGVDGALDGDGSGAAA